MDLEYDNFVDRIVMNRMTADDKKRALQLMTHDISFLDELEFRIMLRNAIIEKEMGKNSDFSLN